MDEEKWERMINIPNEYNPNPDLAKKALQKHLEKESRKISSDKMVTGGVVARNSGGLVLSKKSILIILLSIIVSAVIILSIVLPICLTGKQEILIYNDEKLRFEEIEDLQEFSNVNNLDIKFYDKENTLTKCAYIVETNQIGYLMQDTIFLNDDGFDQINLRIKILQNAQFDALVEFDYCNKTINLDNFIINYSENYSGEYKRYLACFKVGEFSYYLTLITLNGDLEWHIKTLLNI